MATAATGSDYQRSHPSSVYEFKGKHTNTHTTAASSDVGFVSDAEGQTGYWKTRDVSPDSKNLMRSRTSPTREVGMRDVYESERPGRYSDSGSGYDGKDYDSSQRYAHAWGGNPFEMREETFRLSSEREVGVGYWRSVERDEEAGSGFREGQRYDDSSFGVRRPGGRHLGLSVDTGEYWHSEDSTEGTSDFRAARSTR